MSPGPGHAETSARVAIGADDANRLVDWLRAWVPAVDAPLTITLIVGGRSNLTYRVVDAGGRSWVLRRPPLAGVVESAHDVLREHRIMSALAETSVPVPAMIAACADLDLLSTPFFVMADVAGVVPTDQGVAERSLDEAARPALASSLVDALARLHAIEPAEVGLGDLGPGVGYVDRQLRRWGAQLDRLEIEPSDRIRGLLGRLRVAVPRQTETTIVHGDFRPGNVIVGPDGLVRAVLDWELCTLGDPRADVGWLLAYWGQGQAGADDLPFDVPTRAAGFPPREVVLEQYLDRTWRHGEELDYFVAFGFWRLAAILTGVHARDRLGAYGGRTPDPSAADKITRILDLADEATTRAGR